MMRSGLDALLPTPEQEAFPAAEPRGEPLPPPEPETAAPAAMIPARKWHAPSRAWRRRHGRCCLARTWARTRGALKSSPHSSSTEDRSSASTWALRCGCGRGRRSSEHAGRNVREARAGPERASVGAGLTHELRAKRDAKAKMEPGGRQREPCTLLRRHASREACPRAGCRKTARPVRGASRHAVPGAFSASRVRIPGGSRPPRGRNFSRRASIQQALPTQPLRGSVPAGGERPRRWLRSLSARVVRAHAGWPSAAWLPHLPVGGAWVLGRLDHPHFDKEGTLLLHGGEDTRR
jgi:hypothetical protein